MSWGRVILHADLDAFYASVEQRDHPELRDKPVIIGASSPRGVVSAASYEARKFGVRSAMPGYRARELCPNGVFLAGDMKKYAAVSKQVHGVFREFSDAIEPLALDEAFIDITGSIALFGAPHVIGQKLRARVLEETQLVISVGISTSKLVAKIATGLGKPNGLFVVAEGTEEATLAPLPVRRLFGVGPKAEARLLALGVRTMGDLARASSATLADVFGNSAETVRLAARGKDTRSVVTERIPRSIGEESTFSSDVSALDQVNAALLGHSETVAARARRAGLVGRTVVLKVKLAERKSRGHVRLSNHEIFPQLTRQAPLVTPSADGPSIYAIARDLYARLALDAPVRLLGVTLTGLSTSAEPHQLDLYAEPKRRENEALNRAIDAIRTRFGQDALYKSSRSPDKITPSDRAKLGDDD